MRFSRITALCVVVALALPAAAVAKKAPTSYYVSVGDSYAQGYQPDGTVNHGYTDYLYAKAMKLLPGLKLVRLGCGGATTGSLINGTRPCPNTKLYASTSKATSQLTYGARFMRSHRGQIALVTMSIGGNDVAPCATAPDITAILNCVTTGVAEIKKNLTVIASSLRSAAGPKATIIGSTYPDVVLGQYIRSEQGKGLAAASVAIFRDQINPALKSAYAAQQIRFVDATTAFGGYVPFDQTVTDAPYGVIPQAVANICTLGWYCTTQPVPDIHLKSPGYSKLADLYMAQLKAALRK